MPDLSASVVDLLAQHLTGHPQPGTSELADLVRRELGPDTNLRRFEDQATSGAVRPRTGEQLRLGIAEALEQSTGFATAARALVEKATSERVSADGDSLVHQRVSQENKIRTQGKVVIHGHRVRNTQVRLALGGGLALALVAALIWWQYSARSDEQHQVDDYQSQVLAACSAIAQSFSVPGMEPGADGFTLKREDLLANYDTRRDTVISEIDALLLEDAPESLVDEKSAVEQAFAEYEAEVDHVHKRARAQLPEVITFQALGIQSLLQDPRVRPLLFTPANLGRPLSRLAGEACRTEPS